MSIDMKPDLVARLRGHKAAELKSQSDYSRGWNDAQFRIASDAKEAADEIDALRANLASRDEFIVEAGLWSKFVNSLSDHPTRSAGERLIAGVKEARAIAKGEAAAASITVNGHTYYSAEALAAAERAGMEKAAKGLDLDLIQTALKHASFALDGVVSLDDEDEGKQGGSATCQHAKRTVDRALKSLAAIRAKAESPPHQSKEADR